MPIPNPYRLLAGWTTLLGFYLLYLYWTAEGDWGPPWCWVCGSTLLLVAALVSIAGGGAGLAYSLRARANPAGG